MKKSLSWLNALIALIALIICQSNSLILRQGQTQIQKPNFFQQELEILRKKINDEIFQKNLSSSKSIEELKRLYNEKQIEFLPDSNEKTRIEQVEKVWTNPNIHKQAFNYVTQQMFDDDEKSSRILIDKFKKDNQDSVMEFAAGEGRVTKNVLTKKFKHVEVLEPFLYSGKKLKEINSPNIKAVYVEKGENFKFPHKFDFIWGQWFLENITDLDVINFLIKCRENLKENGKIVFKENVENDSLVLENNSGQRMRTKRIYMLFFELVGLEVIYYGKSYGSPPEITPLIEIVLQKRILVKED
jgi:protein N-terminal methyltransferase